MNTNYSMIKRLCSRSVFYYAPIALHFRLHDSSRTHPRTTVTYQLLPNHCPKFDYWTKFNVDGNELKILFF